MTAPRTTIARLRWHRGLTQKQLARLANISVKTVEKIEAGTSKGSPRTAILLAGALAVDVDLIVKALVEDYVGRGQGNGSVVVDIQSASGAAGEQDGELTRATGS